MFDGVKPGDKVKVVFVDGNLHDGQVSVKYGTVSRIDNLYVYIEPEGEKPLQLGHGFIIKIVPTEGTKK